MARVLLILSLIAALATPALAHQSSIKYTDLTVDGARVTVALTIAPPDATAPLGLPDDARPSITEVLNSADKVSAYIATWFSVALPSGAPCGASDPKAGPDADNNFVVVTWTITCPETIDELALDFSRFFAVDQRHEAILTVHAPGKQVDPIVVRAKSPKLVVRAGSTSSVMDWIGYGMDHIYGGLDHVFFVLALLLVVVLQRGEDRSWRVRTPLAALRSTAAIVTAFTVAHSISLIAAALGWIHLPSRLVESVIAASILYTAVENVIKPDVRWRFALTIAFGLIHGLGFASMLEELLPPTNVIVPLLSFNVGVELGQLTIVVVALPVFWGLARLIGADRYRRFVLPIAATPLVLVSIKWLIERVFDITTFSLLGM
ncbi:MAG: HupE/UreJ family protein [Deltaproteobacteria bacterium]|nr:HupE/UreJ family protein [Deltaproteobacteria bacterium]